MQYGFDSQQTFSRVFRRQFSQTPTAYRHNMRRQSALRQRPVSFSRSEALGSYAQRTTGACCPVSG